MSLLLRRVSCRRAGRPVFDGVSLEVRAGESAHVRGPNGSGKTSLLLIAAGLLRPAGGRATLDGAPVRPDDVGFAGHLDALSPALTLRENLELWARIHGAERAAVPSALDALGVGRRADAPARFCSAGERRRAALARLLASGRDVWLLDEPTAGLDDDGADRVAEALRRHLAKGGRAVVATHDELAPPPRTTVRMERHATAGAVEDWTA